MPPTFADTAFGPPHAPLLALLKERHLAPTIICESAGTQAEDAAALAQGTQRCKLDKKISIFPQKSPNRTCKIDFSSCKI